MSPKVADPAIRRALVDEAARIIATEGPSQLTLRRLTREVGTSTMAVYTYFGSMDELRRAVRQEGFKRLADHLAAVGETGDPVADVVALGSAYWANATENANLYRAMFLDGPVGEGDEETGAETFASLVLAMRRCIEAGRFDPADPNDLAMQLWSLTHGLVALHLARMLDADTVLTVLASATRNLFQAFGDDPRATGASMTHALART